MEFKDLVYKKRKELGLSMDELGKKVGVSKATILRWESGEIVNVRRDKIVKLAAALNTTPAYLMGWGEPQKFSTNIKKLMLLRNINSEILAAETKISLKKIERFLENTENPTKQEAETLSNYFNVSYVDLLSGDIEYELEDEKSKKIIKLISKLNDSGKNKVIDYIDDLNKKYFKE